MGDSLRTLKGVGDKTEKLFFKLGIYDTDDLLHYYPRNYCPEIMLEELGISMEKVTQNGEKNNLGLA